MNVSEKSEVFEIIDDRIEAVKRKIEYFEQFGNKSNQQELIKHAINLSCKEVLISLKSDLNYGVCWRIE
ncbi:hypothetical protein D931_01399 [Enterococcus faecium 13.SD.W.09]|nr:hypothetical protein D931_01399 [Enterococcus faecium 13.SD.W.09]DAR03665.1 MAG TPA: hypothetical protein [Caudoviricetes sp.]